MVIIVITPDIFSVCNNRERLLCGASIVVSIAVWDTQYRNWCSIQGRPADGGSMFIQCVTCLPTQIHDDVPRRTYAWCHCDNFYNVSYLVQFQKLNW